MYADREEAAVASKSSVGERLDMGTVGGFSSRPNVSGKRQRQDDDKWEHDLFKDNEAGVSNNKTGTRDLRSKLQRKSLQSTILRDNGLISRTVHDLREKLSGTMHSQPSNNNLPKTKAVEPLKTIKKVADTAPETVTKKVTRPPPKKNKTDTAVDDFLQSLGLEKYLITFKAEEIDMTALMHMSEDDLKVLGIPMNLELELGTFGAHSVYLRAHPDVHPGSKKENTFGVRFQGLRSWINRAEATNMLVEPIGRIPCFCHWW